MYYNLFSFSVYFLSERSYIDETLLVNVNAVLFLTSRLMTAKNPDIQRESCMHPLEHCLTVSYSHVLACGCCRRTSGRWADCDRDIVVLTWTLHTQIGTYLIKNSEAFNGVTLWSVIRFWELQQWQLVTLSIRYTWNVGSVKLALGVSSWMETRNVCSWNGEGSGGCHHQLIYVFVYTSLASDIVDGLSLSSDIYLLLCSFHLYAYSATRLLFLLINSLCVFQ